MSSSLYASVSLFQVFLQRSLPGMKLPRGAEGIWAAGAEEIFYFNSTPNFCARASQTLSLLVPMVRETGLLWGCLSEKTTPAMPCLMWAVDAVRGSGWD